MYGSSDSLPDSLPDISESEVRGVSTMQFLIVYNHHLTIYTLLPINYSYCHQLYLHFTVGICVY